MKIKKIGRRQKLFEIVATEIQREIIDGELRPGDLLPTERDLQELFGVGRPAVREALVSLQKSGLVEISNGMRARVATASSEKIVSGMAPAIQHMLASREGQGEFQRARVFLEAGLARFAARNATDEDRARLKVALEDNKKAIGNRALFVETDIEFHYVIAQVMRNSIFNALHQMMSEWLIEQRRVTLSSDGQEGIAFRAHRSIFKAIDARDENLAESAMTAHIQQLNDVYDRTCDS